MYMQCPRYDGRTPVSQLRRLLAEDQYSRIVPLDESMIDKPVVLIDSTYYTNIWRSGSSPDETLGDAMAALGQVKHISLIWEQTTIEEVDLYADSRIDQPALEYVPIGGLD